jgi:hypothetical protein
MPGLLSLHEAFYDATVEAYEGLRREGRERSAREGTPNRTDTQLNHDFFQVGPDKGMTKRERGDGMGGSWW